MQTFTIKQDGFKEIKKQTLIKMLPLLIILSVAGFIIGTINTKYSNSDSYINLIIIPLVIGYGVFTFYRGVNKKQAWFESYTLTITNNLITRTQLNTPTVAIYFNDIKEICKQQNGNLTIKSKDARDIIAVPSQIDDYAELEMILAQIQPIVEANEVSIIRKYQTLITILFTVGLMICVYTVNNKIIVGLAGSTFISLMIWSFIKIRTNKNIDAKTKNAAWYIFLVIASVIMIMVVKLLGLMPTSKH